MSARMKDQERLERLSTVRAAEKDMKEELQEKIQQKQVTQHTPPRLPKTISHVDLDPHCGRPTVLGYRDPHGRCRSGSWRQKSRKICQKSADNSNKKLAKFC